MSFYVGTVGISAGKTARTLSARHLKIPYGKRWWGIRATTKTVSRTEQPTDLALKPSAEYLKLRILDRAHESTG